MGKSIVTDCARINGSVVLSTCNRFEVYLDVDLDSSVPGQNGSSTGSSTEVNTDALGEPSPDLAQHAVAGVARLISDAANVPAEQALKAFTVRTGKDVVSHLFKVSSGLDSLVVGEREIAGQVRKSLQNAHGDQVTTGRLERLFQRALRTSKTIATETQLSADGRSVVSVALQLASAALPPWSAVSALVVGTGAYAGATVAALRAQGVRDISVYSGSGRAEAFAASHQVIPVTDLSVGVADSDIVVCCSGTGGNGRARLVAGSDGLISDDSARATSATAVGGASVSYVLDEAAVAAARRARAEAAEGPEGAARRQVIVDLALHRDADPRIADLESVLLIDLSTVRANVPSVAEDTVGHAQNVLEEQVREFVELERVRAADQVVTRLVASFTQAKNEQVAELVASGVAEDVARKQVNKSVNPEMHKMIVRMREELLRGVAPEAALESLGLIAGAGR